MKRLIIGIIALIILMSIGLVGTLPRVVADKPEGVGNPSVIVSPLDEDGDVRVSLDEAAISIKFLDGLVIDPDQMSLGEWLDVSSYSKFKIYAKVTPGPSTFPPSGNPPTVQFTVYDAPEEGELGLSTINIPPSELKGFSLPDLSVSFWSFAYEFEGVYSHIAVPVWNFPPEPPFNGDGVTRTIDAWILMRN